MDSSLGPTEEYLKESTRTEKDMVRVNSSNLMDRSTKVISKMIYAKDLESCTTQTVSASKEIGEKVKRMVRALMSFQTGQVIG